MFVHINFLNWSFLWEHPTERGRYAAEIRVTFHMMMLSTGIIFRVTGPLCREFTDQFSSQRPVTRSSYHVFFDLCLNKRLSKLTRRRLFETLSRGLRRHCNDISILEYCCGLTLVTLHISRVEMQNFCVSNQRCLFAKRVVSEII